MMLLLIK